jgi:XTP/dITP diphosphohydrolase
MPDGAAEIRFVTSNKGKLREAREILGREIAAIAIDVDEIQSLDVSKVVREKARRSYGLVKKPVLVEDTGLYIKALNGFPGALIKWALETIGNKGLCEMLGGKDRKAYSETAVCIYDGRRAKIFTGRTDGRVSKSPKGHSTFGWDPIFMPEGKNLTYAEMGGIEKNKISSRAKAFKKLKMHLARTKR